MSSLANIAVKVVTEAAASGGNARPILREIASLLEGLALRGESASIDLRSLPLTPGDYEVLRQTLGEGTVAMRLDAAGVTQARETGCPGAWWVTHAAETGEVLAEFIEVCPVPAIFAAPAEDVAAGLARLNAALAEAGPALADAVPALADADPVRAGGAPAPYTAEQGVA